MKTLLRIGFLGVLVSASSSSTALTIYRCESRDQTLYSEAPCHGGTVVDLSNASPADVEAAKKKVAADKATVKQVEREHRKREAQEEKERQRAAHERASRQKRCGLLAKRKQWADEDAAAATGKSADKLKRKAQRVNEQLEAECEDNVSQQLSIS